MLASPPELTPEEQDAILNASTDEGSEPDHTSAEGIAADIFDAVLTELANIMEQYGVSGYGNVLKGKEAVLAHLDATRADVLTPDTLDNIIRGPPAVRGVPINKSVHRWMKQIVETGECDYIEHVKSTRSRP